MLYLVALPWLLLSFGCGASADDPQLERQSYAAQGEGKGEKAAVLPQVDCVTTAVPWPRGVRYVDGKLYALSRGIHRSAGGPQASIEDMGGSIFEIDPSLAEPAIKGAVPSLALQQNAKVLAAPDPKVVRLWDRRMPATLDRQTDRPYCMLLYDRESQSFFICAYSGIDLGQSPGFRKNASDAVHRYDLRSQSWHVVEQHDPSVVPMAEFGENVSSIYYPHHDPAKNPPPHGLVNGPCGGIIVGRYLYVGSNDNTALAQYDLAAIRKDPNAGPPPGRFIFEGNKGYAEVEVKGQGLTKIMGTCAFAVNEGFLYVAFRTTSQILRFPLREDGGLEHPLVAEKIAQFSRYVHGKGGSADIYDMCFGPDGLLYVSPGYDGAIYRFRPDPKRVWDSTKAAYQPFIDLEPLLGTKKSGNICFDDKGHLYVCSGQDLTPDSKIRGVIYRVRAR